MKIDFRKINGFTLLEVMITLAIAAIALTALTSSLGQSIVLNQELSERMIASWVAKNRLVKRQISDSWPESGEYSGHTNMAGRKWYWRELVEKTDEPRMRRIKIYVDNKNGNADLAILEGYITYSEN